ncbi:DUF2975 domain-containing protein [Winogradskyella flava]|uniref:DUF2975 domain-containing protein n=1 Tax=Winogradskyella flava TaxID=1884876 RepID=A0A842IP32_9FLAO|nr:DUF2975 domain-containing protein [Winogradskyella flava]MBC2843656.1 DUF2975 domain-containing protein [Winogradskyella flava]
MKKIKFLHYFVIALLLINIIWFLRYIYYQPKFHKLFFNIAEVQNYAPYKDVNFLVDMFFYLLTIVGLFFIHLGLYDFIKKGFFNTKSYSRSRRAALLFVISGSFNFVFHVVNPLFKGRNFFELFIGNDFLILVLGIGLYVLADLVQNGNVLKQENDLTI